MPCHELLYLGSRKHRTFLHGAGIDSVTLFRLSPPLSPIGDFSRLLTKQRKCLGKPVVVTSLCAVPAGPGNIIRADSEMPPRRRNATPVLATNGLADAGGQQRLQLAGEHVREELAYTVVQERDGGAAAAASTATPMLAQLALVALVGALLAAAAAH